MRKCNQSYIILSAVVTKKNSQVLKFKLAEPFQFMNCLIYVNGKILGNLVSSPLNGNTKEQEYKSIDGGYIQPEGRSKKNLSLNSKHLF